MAAKGIVSGLNFDTIDTIVEFGPGTGIFTAQLVNHAKPNTKLILIELEPSYNNVLIEKFGDRIIIENTGAETVETVLRKHGCDNCGLIVSSLPFNLPEDTREQLFNAVDRLTKKGTTMRFFTYFPSTMKKIYARFPLTFIKFVPWNFPPMFIYEINQETKQNS